MDNSVYVCNADQPEPIHVVEVKKQFDTLSDNAKLYAHHLARASWHGAPIVMEQNSPESPGIYRFILEVAKSCKGDWASLAQMQDVEKNDVEEFLEYSALFLSYLGNYIVRFPC